jgi:hypothetical protein
MIKTVLMSMFSLRLGVLLCMGLCMGFCLSSCHSANMDNHDPIIMLSPEAQVITLYAENQEPNKAPSLLSVTKIVDLRHESQVFDDSALIKLKLNIENTVYQNTKVPDNISYFVDIFLGDRLLYRLDYPCHLKTNYKNEASFFDIRDISIPLLITQPEPANDDDGHAHKSSNAAGNNQEQGQAQVKLIIGLVQGSDGQ